MLAFHSFMYAGDIHARKYYSECDDFCRLRAC